MTSSKLISIIMPIFNAEDYLIENLAAIKNQTYKNIEVIMVDDGSTDKSAEIAKGFCEADARFSYVKQQNQGAPAARNNGFEKSQGAYVVFVDSDDILAHNSIEKLYRTAEHQSADLVIGQYDTIDEEGNLIESQKMEYDRDGIYSVDEDLNVLFFLSPMPGNKLFDAELLRKNNLLFSDLKRAQDLNFYLKFLTFADKVCTMSDTVYYYRMRANSISHTVSPVILETINSIEDVEKYYNVKGRHNKKLFNILKFNHYSNLIAKTPQIENKEKKKQTYEKLSEELKALDKQDIKQGSNRNKYIKTKLILLFPLLSNSKMYSKLQSIRLKDKSKKSKNRK